jgi:serine/threonine protein kinase
MAAVTREDWDTLDLMEIRRRAERLQTSLTTATLGGGVSLADFVVEKMLGKGANAYAFLARCRPGGKLGAHEDMLVVLKVVGRLKAVGATAEMLVQSAAAFRETVSHDTRKHFPEFRSNIVHVLGHFEDDVSDLPGYAAATAEIREFNDPNTAIIVLPFFSGGDLDGMIKQNARLPEPAILDILAQVADAVVKLQKPTAMSPTGVAHRDLKPDNIFFAGGKTELALADFGCVGPLQLPFIKNTTSPGGAQDYLGPEILARIVGMVDGAEAVLDYSKSDVYAIGMIGYAMCLGEAKASPWPEGIPPQALDVGVLKRIPAGVYSEGLRTLVEGLLSPKADQRMTAKEAHERCYMLRFGGAPVVVPVAPDAPVVAIDAEPEPEPEPEPDPPSDTTPQWEWQDTASGQWTPFGDGLALQIEVAHIAGVRSVDVNEEHPGCFVDPAPHRLNMKSWENPAEVKSKIRRAVAATAPPADAPPAAAPPAAAPPAAVVVLAPVVPAPAAFTLEKNAGAAGYTISGAAKARVNGHYSPAQIPRYRGAQGYVKGDLAIFRWAQKHWVVSDLGPDPTDADKFAEERWLYKVQNLPPADTPPLAGWSELAGAVCWEWEGDGHTCKSSTRPQTSLAHSP